MLTLSRARTLGRRLHPRKISTRSIARNFGVFPNRMRSSIKLHDNLQQYVRPDKTNPSTHTPFYDTNPRIFPQHRSPPHHTKLSTKTSSDGTTSPGTPNVSPPHLAHTSPPTPNNERPTPNTLWNESRTGRGSTTPRDSTASHHLRFVHFHVRPPLRRGGCLIGVVHT